MRLLWLARFPPYPPMNDGACEYSRGLIEGAAREADVAAIGFATPRAPARAGAADWRLLPPPRPSRLGEIASPLPRVAYRHRTRAYRDAAVAAAASADAVVVDFIAMAWAVPALVAALGERRPPLIFVDHNHEGAMRTRFAAHARGAIRRRALRYDAWRAARLENAAIAAADGVVAISDEDAAAFRAVAPTPCIVLSPGYAGPVAEDAPSAADAPPVAAITGNRVSSHKRAVLEATLSACAAAGTLDRIEVAGDGDLAAAAARYPQVRFRGFVDDLAAYARTVRAGVIPDMIGGGFKLRALSHAFLRLPIIALDGAMSGTGFMPGEHYIGFPTIERLAAGLPGALADTAGLDRVREAAFAFARARFDPATRGPALVGFAAALAGRAR